jgi:6-pyruvoyltetrahydropterin/6-carboxytetrahydropterin synthase
VFGCSKLDARHWVVDFGSLKELKADLQKHFDHTTVVAADDPEIDAFYALEDKGIINLVILPDVGCEAFAYEGWNIANRIIEANYPGDRVWVESCEVAEHGANSAIYTSEPVR